MWPMLLLAAQAAAPDGATTISLDEALAVEDISHWQGCTAFELLQGDGQLVVAECPEATVFRVTTGPVNLDAERLLQLMTERAALRGAPSPTSLARGEATLPARHYAAGQKKSYGLVTALVEGARSQGAYCAGSEPSRTRRAWCERALVEFLAHDPTADAQLVQRLLKPTSEVWFAITGLRAVLEGETIEPATLAPLAARARVDADALGLCVEPYHSAISTAVTSLSFGTKRADGALWYAIAALDPEPIPYDSTCFEAWAQAHTPDHDGSYQVILRFEPLQR